MSPKDDNQFPEIDRSKYPIEDFITSEELEEKYNYDDMIKLLPFWRLFVGPVEERMHMRGELKKFLAHPVPTHINFLHAFGGSAFLFFIIQVITGILLAMYYQPTPETAYASVLHISTQVPFGWLIRSIHFWSANMMIIAVMLHMGRVFWHGAYKYPREFNWVVGIMLFLITLGFEFTGYLLPWTQISYWATTIGTEIPSTFPIIGDFLVSFTRGGDQVSAITLTRFYAVHVFVLPASIFGLLGIHFLMVRVQGIAGPYYEETENDKPMWP